MASAKDLDWSFANNPHPPAHKLTGEEQAALTSVPEGQGFTQYCEELVAIQYNIYNIRYPKFADSGPKDERFLAWKYHVVSDGYNSDGYCIINLPYFRATDFLFDVNLVFCGVFAGQSKTEKDHAFQQAVKELVAYAGAGRHSVMDKLLLNHKPGSIISLNPDIELYLRISLQKNDEYEYAWYTAHLEPLLTPERIEFVNAAVERGDFEAVLNTTAACPTQ